MDHKHAASSIHKGPQFWLVPEYFKLASNIAFLITFAGAIVITYIAHPDFDTEHHPLTKKFGYSNICLFMDDMPAKYPSLYTSMIACSLYIAYVLLSSYFIHMEHKKEECECRLNNRCGYIAL